MNPTAALPPTVRAVLRESREDNVTLLAASIAYSAFMSLLALLVLLVFVATVVGEGGFVDGLKDGAVVLGTLVVGVLAAVAASAAFAYLESAPDVCVFSPLLLVLGLALAFFPLYYVFPDTDVSAREVVPGVLVAAVGWSAPEGVFQQSRGAARGGRQRGAGRADERPRRGRTGRTGHPGRRRRVRDPPGTIPEAAARAHSATARPGPATARAHPAAARPGPATARARGATGGARPSPGPAPMGAPPDRHGPGGRSREGRCHLAERRVTGHARADSGRGGVALAVSFSRSA
jgi:hypothetical protein